MLAVLALLVLAPIVWSPVFFLFSISSEIHTPAIRISRMSFTAQSRFKLKSGLGFEHATDDGRNHETISGDNGKPPTRCTSHSFGPMPSLGSLPFPISELGFFEP
ncbi:hypothetical protein BDN72DRAFT_846662 [Pluteus cervinus]|uniref:Uncharacterized protein n=1 Tax=Pluteus cervinus TaxID=181527 RepID=A0ACD3AFN6_9AGAR|nr:hypothetical protein BDN72DRAFT_846662 [Pluteus cervinus]